MAKQTATEPESATQPKIALEATKMFNPEIGPLLARSLNPTLLGIPVQNLPIYACAVLVGYVLWRIARAQKAE